MSKYCGDETINNYNYNILLQKVNNIYGYSDLYCKWVLSFQPTEQVSININKYNKNLQLLANLVIKYNETISETVPLLESVTNFPMSIIGITIQIYLNQTFSSVPFIIHIAQTDGTDLPVKNKTSDTFTSLIPIFLVILLIIGIGIVYIRYRLRKRRMNFSNSIRIERIHTEADHIQRDKLIKKNIEIIENKINDELMPMSFNKCENIYKINNCTICLEIFEDENQVIKLVCSHIYHIDCIKESISRNIINPKCPTCNLLIISEEKQEIVTERIQLQVNNFTNRGTAPNQIINSELITERVNTSRIFELERGANGTMNVAFTPFAHGQILNAHNANNSQVVNIRSYNSHIENTQH